MGKYFWMVAGIGFFSIFIQQISERSPVIFEAFSTDRADPIVEVAGLEPQIEIMREIAGEQGWTTICEGKSGELTVLHFAQTLWGRLSTGENDDATSDLMGGLGLLSSGGMNSMSRSGAREHGCDHPPDHFLSPILSGHEYDAHVEDGDIPLAFGTVEELQPVLDITESCGLVGARVREFAEGEREALRVEEDPSLVVVSIDHSPDLSAAEFYCAGALISRYFSGLEDTN